MKINVSPRLTSKNFRINDFEIDDNLIKKNLKPFDSFKLDNVRIVKELNNLETKYGIVTNDSNFKYELEIIDNNKYGIIDFNINDDLVDKIELNINNNSNYLINYNSKNNTYHNGLIKINVSDNVKANIIVVNNMSSESTNLMSFDNTCNENSNLNYLIVDLGGNISVSNYYSNMVGNNSINNLNSIYVGNKNQVFDINYLVEIFGKNAKCNIDVQGSLSGESKKSFKGTIDFKKGCKGSIGEEKEYCVLLSDKVISKSLPMLLCTEEDVVGNHATASGKVDDKMLFYIMTRGISKKDAEKLIVKANFNKLLTMIKDEEISKIINELIDKKI